MGSGSGGPYSGTRGGSQPYAERYHVIGKELSKDKLDPDIYYPTTGYFKNPTAQNLTDAMTPTRVLFDGKSVAGTLTYVMDKNGEIIFGKVGKEIFVIAIWKSELYDPKANIIELAGF